jgi:hypothetical protein
MFYTSQTYDDGRVARQYTFSGIVDNKGRTVGAIVVVWPADENGYDWNACATRGGKEFGSSWARRRPTLKTEAELEKAISAYIKQAAKAAWKKFPPTLERVEPGAED